ncbi:MAG: hypothetical protein MUF54_23275 [Polyangiaceae bacterium]|nr:hypothetical protein [Polyangiaceae bacterium]
MRTSTLALVAVGVASVAIGCKGSPAAPFNTLQDSQITAFRLQNYEAPTAQATLPPGTATTPSLIPGLPGLPIPPEFQPQVQQAQQMICGFLPPGSPGCTPGGAPGMPTTPATQAAPMFEGFRIIGQAQVMDSDLREDLIDVFGYEKNFGSKKSPCMFPEIGFSFGSMGQQMPANVLVSFSCNQVQARNFTWPHGDNGLTDKTNQELVSIVQKLFGSG